jgi:signal peptidase I
MTKNSLTEKKSNDSAGKKKNRTSIKEVIYFIITVVIIVVPIRTFIAQPFVVSGDSMLPSFHTGEYLIIDQVSYRFNDPQRGDVIVFKFPNDQKRFFIKRIIGLPGETVELKDGAVTIKNDSSPSGLELNEEYVTLPKESDGIFNLEDDEYFAMGDNRSASLDSRSWGPLKGDLIIGRVFLRLIPVEGDNYLPESFSYEN